MWDTKFSLKDQTGFSNQIRLDAGQFYLVFHNKNPNELHYRFEISENYDPPVTSGMVGTYHKF